MIQTREKQVLGEKGILVPLGPPQSYVDIPNAQVLLSTTGHQRQKLQVGGGVGGCEHCDKDNDKRHILGWNRISRREGILSYK
jgi:hypothetical protein